MTASDASKATTESTFLQHMDKLKDIKMPSWRELNAKPHELWTNYADRGNMTWNESKSIMSEGVNKIVDDEVIVCMCVCVCVVIDFSRLGIIRVWLPILLVVS